MAYETISTNQTSTYTIDGNDVVVLLPGVSVSVSDYGIQGGDNGSFVLGVLGTVSAGQYGVHLDSLDDNNVRLNVGATGQILSLGQSTDNAAVYFANDNTYLSSDGLISGGVYGVLYDDGVQNGWLQNTGIISGWRDAIRFSGDDADTDEDTLNLENSGSIRGLDEGAITVKYENLALENTGTIFGNIELVASSDNDNNLSIRNQGQIFGDVVGAGATDLFVNDGTATEFDAKGGDDILRNRGEMDIVQTRAGADRMVNSGTVTNVYMGTGSDTVINTGRVEGEIDLGMVDASQDSLINTGYLGAATTGDGNDTVVNTGAIGGELDFGAGNDTYRAVGGTIAKTVKGGVGDDQFIVDQGDVSVDGGAGNDALRTYDSVAEITGIETVFVRGGKDVDIWADADGITVYANQGNNWLQGGAGVDMLYGRGGTDELAGAAGNDVIYGGLNADRVSGDDGDDTLYGNRGDDELLGGGGKDLLEGGDGLDDLSGGNGDDRLVGGLGNDVLNGDKGGDLLDGGRGADILIGGGGKDVLTGGLGRDAFLYETAAQSPDSASGDRIKDFLAGQDLIDLVAVASGTFTFLGTGAFTGGGDAELRYSVNASGHAIVKLDVDGDGTADGRITVENTATLDASDFIL